MQSKLECGRQLAYFTCARKRKTLTKKLVHINTKRMKKVLAILIAVSTQYTYSQTNSQLDNTFGVNGKLQDSAKVAHG